MEKNRETVMNVAISSLKVAYCNGHCKATLTRLSQTPSTPSRKYTAVSAGLFPVFYVNLEENKVGRWTFRMSEDSGSVLTGVLVNIYIYVYDPYNLHCFHFIFQYHPPPPPPQIFTL